MSSCCRLAGAAREVAKGRPALAARRIFRVARHSPRGAQNDAGFTLLELLVVIAILGLLVAFVAPQALKTLGFA